MQLSIKKRGQYKRINTIIGRIAQQAYESRLIIDIHSGYLRRCLLSGPIVNPPNGQFSGFLHALTAKCPLRRLPYPDPVMKSCFSPANYANNSHLGLERLIFKATSG
jgi:hypothetical protein